MSHVQELVDLLRLESIGVNRFRGGCQDLGFRNLFGGQVLGQSLSAASQTLPKGEWAPHSLHAYFLRRGLRTRWSQLCYEADYCESEWQSHFDYDVLIPAS